MTFSTQRRVEFCDTDMAGIAHFTAFFPMMEAAEHEMLRSLGLSVMPDRRQSSQADLVTWPRIAAACNYVSAARFEDLLRIDVSVAKMGTTSVQYRFRFTRDEDLVAEGTMTVVCCSVPEEGPVAGHRDSTDPQSGGLKKTPIPPSIRELLSQHQ